MKILLMKLLFIENLILYKQDIMDVNSAGNYTS